MTIGRTLWIIVIIKLAIIFFVLKLIFFPDFLGRQSCSKSEYVSRQLTSRLP
ncbi:MAG: DUF4492 domain-containing protein [Prevotellaceae bacterium]|nr:DUF4492 domain-containing protein [Prevotellaceae bacterium]